MKGLLSSEILRIRSRRVLWVTAVGVVAGTLLVLAFVTIRSSPPEPLTERQQAAYEEQHARCLEGRGGYPRQLPPEWGSVEEFCSEVVVPENFSRRHDGDVLRLRGLVDVMQGSSFVGLILALVLGASFAGADWHTGTMSTILVFEPRRLRVLLVRALVTGVTILLFTILVLTVLVVCMWTGASLRGSTQGLSTDFWRHVVETGGRVTAAAVLTSWIGLAIAMVGRNTAAAMGVLLGYIAVFEVLFRGLSERVATRLLVSNIVVMIQGTTLEIDRVTDITLPEAVGVVAIYTAGVLLVAAAIFRARDVT